MRFFKGLMMLMTLVLVSCSGAQQSVDTPRKVKCKSAVKANNSTESGIFPGKVVAATDVNLGFRVAGLIENICTTEGSYVREGEVIAKLDSRDYALQLAATQAEYDAVKAEVNRVVALYADKSVSANDYDKATNGLRAITAKLEAHKNALADTELRAPMNGYVHKTNFNKGEAVAAGTPVVSLISSSAPEIIIDIPAAYYLKQNNFDSATAKIDLFENTTFNLKLKGISPKANLNQLYKATFIIENQGNVIPSVGMSAMVEIKYSTDNDNSVLIPFSAIVEKDGESSVWIVTDNKVKSRKVKVGEIKSSGLAIVEDGVSVDEKVVCAGVNSLKEGQEISILEDAAESNVGGIK